MQFFARGISLENFRAVRRRFDPRVHRRKIITNNGLQIFRGTFVEAIRWQSTDSDMNARAENLFVADRCYFRLVSGGGVGAGFF